jgi:hypothetical protein
LRSFQRDWINSRDPIAEDTPAQVILTFKPFGSLEVQTKNAHAFGGHGAEFDGKYLRSSAEAPKIE